MISRAFLTRSTAPAEQTALATAFGEPDDHLRLVLLLAGHMESRGGVGELDEARACRDPKTTWRDRLTALKSLLDNGVPAGLCLVDLDALYHGDLTPDDRWDDASFVRERVALFDVLVEAAARGGWTLLRPVRNVQVTLRLEEAGIAVETDSQSSDPPENGELAARIGILSPEIRPLADWLLRQEIISPARLEKMLEAAEDDDPDQAVITTVCDCLPRSTRETGMRLSALRPAQSLNGYIGPFSLVDQNPASGALSRDSVVELRDAGFLQPWNVGSDTTVRMPRLVRQYFSRRAEVVRPDDVRKQHAWLASLPYKDTDAASVAEVHYHAVMACDANRALETAKFYASDLRQLGYRLSLDKRFGEAADVYEAILRFDPADAYAWEYLAYNLARLQGRRRPSDQDAQRIEEAYTRAHRLEPDNPLYHGRLLGFRAGIGRDVMVEFGSALLRYNAKLGRWGVGFFARPVLKGLRRGRQRRARDEISRRWGSFLRSHVQLADLV